MNKNTTTLTKYFRYLFAAALFGSLLICYIDYTNSKRIFKTKVRERTDKIATELSNRIDKVTDYSNWLRRY